MILLLGATGYVGHALNGARLCRKPAAAYETVMKPLNHHYRMNQISPYLLSDGGLELLGKQRKEFAEGKGSEEPSAWESASHWAGVRSGC